MVHYAVGYEGKVVGSRSSKSHAVKVYTHAVVALHPGDPVVISYHSTEALAHDGQRTFCRNDDGWRRFQGSPARDYVVRVVPVMTTNRRAKVGEPLFTLPTVAL